MQPNELIGGSGGHGGMLPNNSVKIQVLLSLLSLSACDSLYLSLSLRTLCTDCALWTDDVSLRPKAIWRSTNLLWLASHRIARPLARTNETKRSPGWCYMRRCAMRHMLPLQTSILNLMLTMPSAHVRYGLPCSMNFNLGL